MNNLDNERLYHDWVKWQKVKKFLKIAAALIVLLIAIFVSANGQERAVLVSSEKIPFSTYYKVTVSDSCNVYESKWNSHCFRCTESEIPKTWDVIKTSKGKYFIKPVL